MTHKMPSGEQLLSYDKTTEVLKHIDYLIDGGASARAIARGAGLNGWTISRLLSGETARVTERTYESIVGLKLEDIYDNPRLVDQSLLDDILNTNQKVQIPRGCKYTYIKALHEEGWGRSRIAARLNANYSQIQEALGEKRIERKSRPVNVPAMIYKAVRGGAKSLTITLRDEDEVVLGEIQAALNPTSDHWEVLVALEQRGSLFRTEVMNLPEMQNDPWAVVRVALTRRGRQNEWR